MQTNPGFGIYIHWPFCLSKCPYCDFNSHVAAGIDQERWRRALLAELGHFAMLAARRRVDSVFFGGGTPSLMPPETVAALIEGIGRLWPASVDPEITLEANPGAADAARFAAFRDAGVNRLSLGIQALNDADLKFLGRRHDLVEALEAIALARRHFPRISFDLIYARPGQDEAAWRAELGQALELAADHLSLYQLTIEEGTAFHPAHARGDFLLPDDDAAARLYEATQEVCAAAGLGAYEVSNHARPGAECRHNLVYWRGGEWLGIGPGAHGRLLVDGAVTAFRQHRAPQIWLERVAAHGHGGVERTVLEPVERIEELVMMGLRLSEGLDARRFQAQTGRPLRQALDAQGLAQMEEGGFVAWHGEALRATPAGRLLLNRVTAALLA